MFEQDLAARNYEQEIARLTAEISLLKEEVTTNSGTDPRSSDPQVIPSERTRTRRTLVPGFSVSTVEGSLYDAILRALATAGRLEEQEFLFQKFKKSPTRENAQRLLGSIAIYKSELEALLRADTNYQEHCHRRTLRLQRLVAAGDPRAAQILSNPKICSHGRWVGDVTEAINILRGARTIKQLERGRNVRILRLAGLMFDVIKQEGVDDMLFLFPRKHHRLMGRARTSVGM